MFTETYSKSLVETEKKVGIPIFIRHFLEMAGM